MKAMEHVAFPIFVLFEQHENLIKNVFIYLFIHFLSWAKPGKNAT